MASPNLSEIITTTLRSRTGEIADNVSKNTALLYRLKAKGKVKPITGGSEILQELSYAENGTFQYYSGYETLNITPSDVLTAASFNFKQASVAVTVSGLDMIQNHGKEKVIELVDARMEVAEDTMVNNLSTGAYSDGTGSGGKQIGGLQSLIANTTGGTVGNINSGTWPFWQNIIYSGVTNGGAAVSTANIQNYMNATWVQLVRNSDKPDLIVADNNYWTFYLQSLQAIQRITNTDLGAAGFNNLKYMDADVVLDGGVGGGMPANTMYFINTKYLFWRPSTARDSVNGLYVTDADRVPVNQDAVVKMLFFAGNLTCSNRRLQGVLIA